MARKLRDGQDEVPAVAFDVTSSRTEIVDDSAVLIDPAPVLASAVERDGRLAVEVPPVPRYAVQRQTFVMMRGARVLLRAGKIVDAANYDIAALRSQGVALVEIPNV